MFGLSEHCSRRYLVGEFLKAGRLMMILTVNSRGARRRNGRKDAGYTSVETLYALYHYP